VLFLINKVILVYNISSIEKGVGRSTITRGGTQMKRISENELKKKRVLFKKGTVIELIKMNDPYVDMPKGLKGVVTHVDDIGTIHTNWENGSSLGVCDEDEVWIVKKAN